MLTYLLVWTVALGSIALYAASYIFPELYRKNDLLWAGIGLFYALILWVYAGRFNGGLVLGQMAGVSLLVWLGWQTMAQRRELTPMEQQTPVPDWLQKIVDVVGPIWTKGTTAISTQVSGLLGLEPTDAEKPAAPLTWADLKEQANRLFKGGAAAGIDAEMMTTDAIATEVTAEEDEDWGDEEEETAAAGETVEDPVAVAPPVETAPASESPAPEPVTMAPPEVHPPEVHEPAHELTHEPAHEPEAQAATVEVSPEPTTPPAQESPSGENGGGDEVAPETPAPTPGEPPEMGSPGTEPSSQTEPQGSASEDSNWPPEPVD